MRIGINLKLIRRILVISLLSFSIVLGVKYVLDLREVYNRVDFVVEEDRRKYLEIFNGFLVSAANSFERKFVRFASDLSTGKYEDPAEDSRKSNTLSGMFSQSYEKTFFLVCTNWMENICGESTFPFMHNVKMWIRDDRIFDSAADVHSRLFHLDDAFFLA
ncbi:MAG: hypothetical protein EOM23_08995, partial [Candidatus Moranbacteria bacterium]|nr:hypothetical protein [Candidatus Moranbacteria bacterium]